MGSQTLAVDDGQSAQDWQTAIAIGFLALTWFGAALDRRGTILDRSSAASRMTDRSAVPLTDAELVREMLAHD
ncbi:hypothetical protein [Methylobacterium gnaphalii]|uniref:Uncharacterized protein n=1 Tax=Methylobacterium gnaphalii TaxID=1010610 RepID=A0A512JH23_9HYPH|nr:hypothetical protein [Methylobacterium gnaphalii]GEP09254.1 hypothetical protein MGN01_10990 [Methylobacterium gnaphalii]GJD69034.1 hypothetical protein MMMDOFMJ_1960 [Methylobacterium gnaphalii]GLS49246.1 hypothetical protein GCM10007885_20940 [Methylobacterium gnaphalii]